jgi:uncharacterized membrane protein YfcA
VKLLLLLLLLRTLLLFRVAQGLKRRRWRQRGFLFAHRALDRVLGAGFISASDSDSESDNPSASLEPLRCLPHPFFCCFIAGFFGTGNFMLIFTFAYCCCCCCCCGGGCGGGGVMSRQRTIVDLTDRLPTVGI